MKSIYNYIIFSQNRYNNSADVDGKELILNTEITERDYQFVNRIGTIVSTPLLEDSPIKEGVEVILHHNVFRRWIDVRGVEKDSSSLIKEDYYMVSPDQIYAYKENNEWKCPDQYCFVKPINDESKWSTEKEQKLLGELVYSNEYLESLGLACGDVVGFTPDSEYEFNIDDKNYIEFYQIT